MSALKDSRWLYTHSDVCMCVDTSVVLCPLKANKEERGKEDGYCISSQAHSPKAHRSDD